MNKRFRIKSVKKGGSKFLNYPQFGVLCLKSMSYGILTATQLESIRRCILRKIKKKGLIWIRTYCTHPVTKKSEGSRMGKGVGGVKYYIANVKRGKILIELQVLVSKEILLLLKKLVLRLPVKCCVLLRAYY